MHWEAHDTGWIPAVEPEGMGQADLSIEATHGVNSSGIFGRQTWTSDSRRRRSIILGGQVARLPGCQVARLPGCLHHVTRMPAPAILVIHVPSPRQRTCISGQMYKIFFKALWKRASVHCTSLTSLCPTTGPALLSWHVSFSEKLQQRMNAPH